MTNKNFLKNINYLLKAKMYEKHGISRKAYIEICRKTWDENQNLNKIIVDTLYPLTINKMYEILGYHFDYSIQSFSLPIQHSKDLDDNKFISSYHLMLIDNDGKPINKPKVSYPYYWSDKTVNEGAYYLCYFDVLGFTNMVNERSAVEVYSLYETILKKARVNRPYTVSLMNTHEAAEYTLPAIVRVPFKYAYYSDTILFWAPGDSNSLSGFIAKCIDFFNVAIKSGILLRGAITFGNAIFNKTKNIFIGQPLIEAAKLEQEQQWAGVIFGESIYNNNLLRHVDNSLVLSSFPYCMKRTLNGKIYHVGINWMARLDFEELKLVKTKLVELKGSAPLKSKNYINNTLLYAYYYMSCFRLDNLLRSQVKLSQQFPIEIKEPIDDIKLSQDYIFKVVFIELKSAQVISGFIFVLNKKNYDITPGLKDLLLFVEIYFIEKYENHLLYPDRMFSLGSKEWITPIKISEIEKIYS